MVECLSWTHLRAFLTVLQQNMHTGFSVKGALFFRKKNALYNVEFQTPIPGLTAVTFYVSVKEIDLAHDNQRTVSCYNPQPNLDGVGYIILRSDLLSLLDKGKV